MKFSPYTAKADLADSLAPAALFALSHGVVVAMAIVSIRQNLAGGAVPTLAAFLHLGALAGCVLAGVVLGQRRFLPGRQFGLAAGALVAYLLPLAGLLLGPATLLVTGGLTALGLAISIRSSFRAGLSILAWSVMGGVVSGLWLAITLNADIYAHALSYEFTLFGWQAADPTFHSAIAALFRTYGSVTHGVDATAPIFYHALTHIVAAGLSAESGEALPLVYPGFSQVFLIPGLLFGTSAAVVSLSRRQGGDSLAAPFLVILSWLLYEWLGNHNSFLLSESYSYSLGLLTFSLVFSGAGPRSGAVLRWLLLALSVAIVAVAAKFTVALAWSLLLPYGLWRAVREQPRRIRIAYCAAALAGYGLLVLLLLLFLDVGQRFEWFGYATQLFRFFKVSAIALGLGVAGALIGRRLSMPTPPWYALVALFLALHLPDNLIRPDGNEYYWYHPADQIGLVVAAAVACVLLARGARRVVAPAWSSAPLLLAVLAALPSTREGLSRSIATLGTTYVALESLSQAKAMPVFERPYAGARAHAMAAALLATSGGMPFEPASGQIGALEAIARTWWTGIPATVGDLAAGTPLGRAARAIAGESAAFPKSQQALFIGPDNAWYWDAQADCFARPFAIQSVTGLALLAGLPQANERCADTHYYNLGLGEDARIRELDRRSLCRMALSRGLGRVVVVSAPDQVASLACAGE